MCADDQTSFYYLRRAGTRLYVRTDDGCAFDLNVSRDDASTFCVHSARAVRDALEGETGHRFCLVLAIASTSIDALAAQHPH